MTRQEAINAAKQKARATNEYWYVVYDCGKYDYCNLFDLGTFYAGAQPVAEIFPDGEVQQ